MAHLANARTSTLAATDRGRHRSCERRRHRHRCAEVSGNIIDSLTAAESAEATSDVVADYLTWRELIHTSYFDDDEFWPCWPTPSGAYGCLPPHAPIRRAPRVSGRGREPMRRLLKARWRHRPDRSIEPPCPRPSHRAGARSACSDALPATPSEAASQCVPSAGCAPCRRASRAGTSIGPARDRAGQ